MICLLCSSRNCKTQIFSITNFLGISGKDAFTLFDGTLEEVLSLSRQRSLYFCGVASAFAQPFVYTTQIISVSESIDGLPPFLVISSLAITGKK